MGRKPSQAAGDGAQKTGQGRIAQMGPAAFNCTPKPAEHHEPAACRQSIEPREVWRCFRPETRTDERRIQASPSDRATAERQAHTAGKSRSFGCHHRRARRQGPEQSFAARASGRCLVRGQLRQVAKPPMAMKARVIRGTVAGRESLGDQTADNHPTQTVRHRAPSWKCRPCWMRPGALLRRSPAELEGPQIRTPGAETQLAKPAPQGRCQLGCAELECVRQLSRRQSTSRASQRQATCSRSGKGPKG